MGMPVSRETIMQKVDMITNCISPNTRRCIVVAYPTQNGTPIENKVSARIIPAEALREIAGKVIRKFLIASGARMGELEHQDFHVVNSLGDASLRKLGGRFSIEINGRETAEGIMIVVPIKVGTFDERMINTFGRDSVFLANYATQKIATVYTGEDYDLPIRKMKHRAVKNNLLMAEKLYPFPIYENSFYEIVFDGQVPSYVVGSKLVEYFARNTSVKDLKYGGFAGQDISGALHERMASLACNFWIDGPSYELVTVSVGILPADKSGISTSDKGIIEGAPFRIRRIPQNVMSDMLRTDPNLQGHVYR